MNYLSVENISKSYGELLLFENLTFGISENQKVGFLAKNGSGKTTILNILAGLDAPDQGQVVYRKDIVVSYLPQNPVFDLSLTIEQTVFASDNPILKVIKNYEEALKFPDDSERYQAAFEAMEAHQAWDFETLYKQILSKFKLENLETKVNSLSGGQKRRLSLAHALLSKPDLLILDEPTNHLDLEMIEWLEAFFAKENITLFMVTHDRYFLERVCNEIIELDQGLLYSYKGNYAYFLEKKEARLAAESTETEKAKQLYSKELDWMRRQPKARTTKSKSRIQNFYEIKERSKNTRNDHKVELEINMERLGSKIVELHQISKKFDETVLLNKFNYNFQKGERIGIIGKNGTGKSTFLNILTGTLAPDQGKVVVGDTIKFGYYNQKGIEVKTGQKVIDVIREFGDYIPLKKGRQLSAQQLLERFLFDRKKQYDFVEKLSGGEQKRLYLCTVLIQNPNFLILDEPTNDLDIDTLNVLENFLLDYPGCLLVVSHDRYFMDKIVDHLFVFRGNGEVEDFPGNYSDFRAFEKLDDETSSNAPSQSNTSNTKNTWRNDNNNSKLTYNEQKEYSKLEKEIQKLEKNKLEIETEFANQSWDAATIEEKSKELQKIIENIEIKTERWFELSSKMEA